MSLQPSCSKIVLCLSQTSSAGFRAQDMNPSSDSSSTKGGGCCWDFCHFPLEGCRLPMDYKAVVFPHYLLPLDGHQLILELFQS